jgi:hypothetical protein
VNAIPAKGERCSGGEAEQASPWREFLFALYQVQRAIEPALTLQETLARWPEIERDLAESTRKRRLQGLFLA